MTAPPLRSVIVVGAGGNIGSHLVPHLARMEGVGRLALVDRDVYEAANLRGQDIVPGDVGRQKVAVQARRLRLLNPALQVEAIAAAVEDLPLGRMRADVILTGLDSRRARQRVNEAAWRLGVPWVDAGVDGAGLLARVAVYRPGAAAACLECPWDERDYALLEQSYPCQPDASNESPATRAPAEIGALAAALEAIECRKLLEGGREQAAVARQLVLDRRFDRQHVSVCRRNQACRRSSDHAPWCIERMQGSPRDLSLEALVEAAREHGVGEGPFVLRVAGQFLLAALRCETCGRSRAGLWLYRTARPGRSRCSCGGRLVAWGFDVRDRVDLATIGPNPWRRTLAGLGMQPGEVVSIAGARREVHLEIAG